MQSVDTANQHRRRHVSSGRVAILMLASLQTNCSEISGLTRLTNPRGSTMSESASPDVVARLDRLDQKVGQLLELIAKQKTIKDS
jgi:hypothetical protein